VPLVGTQFNVIQRQPASSGISSFDRTLNASAAEQVRVSALIAVVAACSNSHSHGLYSDVVMKHAVIKAELIA
jgi:hypothetical protein